MPEVYVGLGSNLDAEHRLREAARALEAAFGSLRRSSVYSTPAVGGPAPDYLNAAVMFSTDLTADAIKSQLVEIEDAARRTRSQPRAGALVGLDLDLLLYGRRVDGERRLPHGDVLVRAHVLAPLADIAGDLVHPLTGQRIADAWAALERGVKIAKIGPLGGA